MNVALNHLAQSYTTNQPNSSMSGTALAVILLIYLALIVFFLYVAAKVYMKAGRKWWEAIVPIYNIYVLQQIVGRPGWWTLLYFIPLVNIVVQIINYVDLAKSFGKGTGTGILLLFFPYIMYPIMAFSSDYQYHGPSAGGDVSHTDDTPPSTDTRATTTDSSDTTGPQPPASTEPAPTAPEVPTSTPPENSVK